MPSSFIGSLVYVIGQILIFLIPVNTHLTNIDESDKDYYMHNYVIEVGTV